MDHYGCFTPESESELVSRFESLETTAKVLVRQLRTAFDRNQDYVDDHLDQADVDTIKEIVFGSHLEIHAGTRQEFDQWFTGRSLELIEIGSSEVDHIAWHHSPFVETVLAATFENEPEAAVETLRRQAIGRLYREYI